MALTPKDTNKLLATLDRMDAYINARNRKAIEMGALYVSRYLVVYPKDMPAVKRRAIEKVLGR
jgi:hypothetical protein